MPRPAPGRRPGGGEQVHHAGEEVHGLDLGVVLGLAGGDDDLPVDGPAEVGLEHLAPVDVVGGAHDLLPDLAARAPGRAPPRPSAAVEKADHSVSRIRPSKSKTSARRLTPRRPGGSTRAATRPGTVCSVASTSTGEPGLRRGGRGDRADAGHERRDPVGAGDLEEAGHRRRRGEVTTSAAAAASRAPGRDRAARPVGLDTSTSQPSPAGRRAACPGPRRPGPAAPGHHPGRRRGRPRAGLRPRSARARGRPGCCPRPGRRRCPGPMAATATPPKARASGRPASTRPGPVGRGDDQPVVGLTWASASARAVPPSAGSSISIISGPRPWRRRRGSKG